MRAPTGNSHDRSSQSKPTAGGETNRRRKPVAGSTHSRCSLRLTSAGASPSMSASRRETVVRCAPASRPSTDAVGLTSPFSIRDREARLTPLSAESSSSDQLRARRNARRRSASRISAAASHVGDRGSTSGRILSEMRASRRCFPDSGPGASPICARRPSLAHFDPLAAEWTDVVVAPRLHSGLGLGYSAARDRAPGSEICPYRPSDDTYAIVLAGLFLGATVFTDVHHAEVLALKLGEPFGSILLAVAVTVIEAGLIVSIMVAGAEGSERVARDTVFAAVMIVLNGVVGLCLVLGARKHFEQTFQLQGAASALAVLGTLATLALILPNFAEAASGPSYSILQLEGHRPYIGGSVVRVCVRANRQASRLLPRWPRLRRFWRRAAQRSGHPDLGLEPRPASRFACCSRTAGQDAVLSARRGHRRSGAAEGLRRRRYRAHRAHARRARRGKVHPSQSAAEQHQSRARLGHRQYRPDDSDGRRRLDRAQPSNRARRFADGYDASVADALHPGIDPGHRPNDRAAGCRTSRYLRRVHACVGCAVNHARPSGGLEDCRASRESAVAGRQIPS